MPSGVFTVFFFLLQTVDLKPNGSQIPVTEENKMEYLQLVAEYRLQDSVKQEIASFSKGFHTLINDELISIFDENELEVWMCVFYYRYNKSIDTFFSS